MNNLVYEQVVELNRKTMKETVDLVDLRLNSLIEAMAWISTDETITTSMNFSSMDTSYSKRYILSAKDGVGIYITATPIWNYLNKIVVYNENGITFAYTNFKNGFMDDVEKLTAQQESSVLDFNTGSSVKLYFGQSLNYPYENVLIARSKVSNAAAWVYAEIDLSVFNPLFFSENAEAVYVIAPGFSYPNDNFEIYENKNFMKEEMNITIDNTKVVWYTDFHPFTLSSTYGLTIFLIVAITASILIIFLSIYFSNRVSKPISHLGEYATSINESEEYGLVNDSIEVGNDEIAKIGKTINKINLSISNLTKWNEKLFEEKKYDEFRILQMQINPHFLYNTLESIRHLAVLNKEEGIASMSRGLSALLKNIAKGHKDKITLKEELSLLSEYDLIQQVRFMGMFDLTIDVSEELMNLLIPSFILQPIVENSIFHGIEPRGELGEITVTASTNDTHLRVFVTDNGVGMTMEEIEHIFDIKERDDQSMTGIGVRNVRDRIKLLYGDSASIKYESVKNEYTTVILEFPIEVKRNE